MHFIVEDELDDAGAIAHVEEEEISEVAAASDPAHHDGVFIGVGGAEIAAVVSAGEVAEEIEQGGRCPLLERAGADLLYLAAREFAAFAELQPLRLSEAAKMIDQLRLREFDLVAVGQILQSPGAFGDFVFAEDECESGAELVGLAQGFAEFEFG